jgi:YHS domain-containing protein
MYPDIQQERPVTCPECGIQLVSAKKKAVAHDEHGASEPIPVGQPAVCPVTGGTVGTRQAEAIGHVRGDYKGKKYYFCCSACLKRFDKQPEQYVDKGRGQE